MINRIGLPMTIVPQAGVQEYILSFPILHNLEVYGRERVGGAHDVPITTWTTKNVPSGVAIVFNTNLARFNSIKVTNYLNDYDRAVIFRSDSDLRFDTVEKEFTAVSSMLKLLVDLMKNRVVYWDEMPDLQLPPLGINQYWATDENGKIFCADHKDLEALLQEHETRIKAAYDTIKDQVINLSTATTVENVLKDAKVIDLFNRIDNYLSTMAVLENTMNVLLSQAQVDKAAFEKLVTDSTADLNELHTTLSNSLNSTAQATLNMMLETYPNKILQEMLTNTAYPTHYQNLVDKVNQAQALEDSLSGLLETPATGFIDRAKAALDQMLQDAIINYDYVPRGSTFEVGNMSNMEEKLYKNKVRLNTLITHNNKKLLPILGQRKFQGLSPATLGTVQALINVDNGGTGITLIASFNRVTPGNSNVLILKRTDPGFNLNIVQVTGSTFGEYFLEYAGVKTDFTVSIIDITELATSFAYVPDPAQVDFTLGTESDYSGNVVEIGLFTPDLETKLSGIAAGANKYIHPTTHPASMIETGGDRQWMTADEKTKLAAAIDITVIEPDINKGGLQKAASNESVKNLKGTVDANGQSIGSIETRVAALENTLNNFMGSFVLNGFKIELFEPQGTL